LPKCSELVKKEYDDKEQARKMASKKSYTSQTAVDSFFNYLYYSPQMGESEKFADSSEIRHTACDTHFEKFSMTPGF
jgi:hypothetical protein